jgi:hypothetical protein
MEGGLVGDTRGASIAFAAAAGLAGDEVSAGQDPGSALTPPANCTGYPCWAAISAW